MTMSNAANHYDLTLDDDDDDDDDDDGEHPSDITGDGTDDEDRPTKNNNNPSNNNNNNNSSSSSSSSSSGTDIGAQGVGRMLFNEELMKSGRVDLGVGSKNRYRDFRGNVIVPKEGY